jgi:DNA cross-link repair 1A protein
MSPAIADVVSRHQKNGFKYTDLKPTRGSTSKIEVYGVPYSEHSSFFELSCFAVSRALNWGKMIATVNVGSER